jgi:hypothetical protein
MSAPLRSTPPLASSPASLVVCAALFAVACSGKGSAEDTAAVGDGASDGAADDAGDGTEVPGALVLNEMLSSSDQISEFIEIYNGTDGDLDLSAWAITDGYAIGAEPFAFPAGTVVPAGAFLIVWADDGEGTEEGLHAPFKLKKDGEIITFFDASGAVFEEVSLPAMQAEQSFSRLPDGGAWAIIDGYSPGAPNPAAR